MKCGNQEEDKDDDDNVGGDKDSGGGGCGSGGGVLSRFNFNTLRDSFNYFWCLSSNLSRFNF